MLRILLLALALVVSCTSTLKADAIKVGGAKGDYALHFAPPLQAVLEGAWFNYPIETGEGTPDSMQWLCEHQNGVAFLQGNVYAELASDPSAACQVQVLTYDLANEAVIAVMNQETFERSEGSWAAVAKRASRVRFVTSSELSGPGRTFKQLMLLSPDGLGKASPVFAKDMDEAIKMVADGKADVAFMVQFANMDNPRFKAIKDKGLHIVPVVDRSMRELKLPNGDPAFALCNDVQVEKSWFGFGEDRFIQTACTPMLIATGVNNNEPEIISAVQEAKREDLLPKESGFRALLTKVQTVTGPALQQAFDSAEQFANDVAGRM